MMKSRSTSLRNAIAVVAVALLGLGAVAVASAAPTATPLTGIWTGTAEQDLQHLETPYTTRILLKAYKGRIIDVVAELRLECGPDKIQDARVSKSFRIGRGPLITSTGRFALKVTPNGAFSTHTGYIAISGTLGKALGDGNISGASNGCQGAGIWKAKRR